jgi:hypothetical protein
MLSAVRDVARFAGTGSKTSVSTRSNESLFVWSAAATAMAQAYRATVY